MARYQKKNQAVSMNFKADLDLTMINSIAKACKQAHTKHIRFGWINGKKYRDKKNKSLYIAQVARWNEFGTSSNGLPLFKGGNGGMPPRPSLTYTRLAVEQSLTPYIKDYFLSALNGHYDSSKLNAMNTHIKKSFSDVIMNQGFAKLKPTTIKLKGHDFILDGISGMLLHSFESKTFSTNHSKIRDGAT